MSKPTIDALRANLKKLSWPREHRERGKVQLRAQGDGRTLEMFIPFESESVDMGFREKIDAGAFTRSIRAGRSSQRNDIFALWSHDSSQPLARQANDTLDFEEDAGGVTALATLQPDIDYHERALKAVKAGLVRGTSFGFETVRDEWAYDDDGEATRTLLEVKLFEVSPVVFPAYPESDLQARSMLAQIRESMGTDPEDLFAMLRDIRNGKVPLERREALVDWIDRLTWLLPEAPVDPLELRYREVARRERLKRDKVA